MRVSSWGKTLLICSVLVAVSPACKSSKQKMEDAQKKRDAEKKAYADAEEAKRKAAIPKIEYAKLDAPWAGADYINAANGKPCPDGLWSLFSATPGEGAEKTANEAKRADLATKMKAATFVAVMHAGGGVDILKYNPKKKALIVSVDGVLECFDGLGLLTLAWGDPAKPFRAPKADEDEDEPPQPPQSVWRARPLLLPIPFDTAADAKHFSEKDGVGLDVRIVFTLGKVDIDKRNLKSSRPLPDAGAVDETVDWGAGRLVHVNVVAVRAGTDHEKHEWLAQIRKPQ